jgi:hypothetical protein
MYRDFETTLLYLRKVTSDERNSRFSNNLSDLVDSTKEILDKTCEQLFKSRSSEEDIWVPPVDSEAALTDYRNMKERTEPAGWRERKFGSAVLKHFVRLVRNYHCRLRHSNC